MLSVGIDIGGTFTDLFAVDEATGAVHQAKSLTTPDDLSRGVFDCLEKAALDIGDVETLVHGSTVAINIAIERTGAPTALAVTRGTRDVYAIGRGNRPEAYNPFFKRPVPFVPRHRTFEAEERRLASGEALVELDPAHAEELARTVAGAGAESVAVCFLHSYDDPSHEEEMGRALRAAMPDGYISLSHEIVREYREYERTSTTVLNAYVGPRTREYVEQIEDALERRDFHGRFLIMQSNGGVMSPETAKHTPVAMMESGPVSGVIASAHVGTQAGHPDVITFDMGGTTAKSSLVRDSDPTIAHGYFIGGYASGHPAMLPVVDIVEVGAGGGSIAWLDDVGALKVGPGSAGADPGPICYRRGGTEPTVTDANVVLGRIGAESFLGGEMRLDAAAARAGIEERLGDLGLGETELAMGIVRLAVASMVLAVRGVSVERGFDPRDFAMLAQGGAGPLHALEIARELGVPRVIVPPLPAHFSAVGMLMADLRHDYVRTHYAEVGEARFPDVEAILEELVEHARTTLASEGVRAEAMSFVRSIDLRYVGQEFSLTVPFGQDEIAQGDADAIRRHFNEAHRHRYGHAADDEEVEMVNLRVTAQGHRRKPELPRAGGAGRPPLLGTRPVWFADPEAPVECGVYARDRMGADAVIEGPAVLEEHASTTLLWPGDVARVGESGGLVVEVGGR